MGSFCITDILHWIAESIPVRSNSISILFREVVYSYTEGRVITYIYPLPHTINNHRLITIWIICGIITIKDLYSCASALFLQLFMAGPNGTVQHFGSHTCQSRPLTFIAFWKHSIGTQGSINYEAALWMQC